MMLFYKNSLFISLLSSSLCGLFLLSPAHAMEEGYEDTLGSQATSFLTARLQDDVISSEYYNTAQQLLYSQNEEEKQIGILAFREMIKIKGHPYFSSIAHNLYYLGDEEDKSMTVSILRELVQDSFHPDRSHAAQILIQSSHEEDKRLAEAILRELVQDKTNPNYFNISYALFYHGNAEAKEMGTCALRDQFKLENDPYQKLQMAITIGNTEYLMQVALDTSQPNELRTRALSSLLPYTVNDTGLLNSLRSTISDLLRDEAIPMQDRFQLLPWLEVSSGASEPIYQGLFHAFLPEHKDVIDSSNLGHLLALMLNSEYPEVQRRAETVFLDNPLRFLTSTSFSAQLPEFLELSEENKKNVWLQKICEALQSSALEEGSDFETACCVLRMSDQDQFVIPAKNVFLKMMDIHLDIFMSYAKSLLQSLKDEELKNMIISRLFTLAQRINMGENPFSNSHHQWALEILIKQKDEKTRAEAIALCQKLVDSIHQEKMELVENFLCSIGLTLNKIEEGKTLAIQILNFLEPESDRILSAPDAWSDHEDFLALFMKLGNEKQQHQIYNIFKRIITEGDEEDAGAAGQDAVSLLRKTFGIDHHWTQEAIELVTKLENSSHPNSSFGVHKILKEKIKQPVVHNPPHFQLNDGRAVTFNLPTLQKPRSSSVIPMKHMEFVSLAKRLVKDAEKHAEEFISLAESSLSRDPPSALEVAEKSFFRNLLDENEGVREGKKISLISQKLRQILASAKSLYDQDCEEKETPPSQGLPASSQLILSLLNNVLTCPTGKEDGIDQTYRLLTNRQGAPEEEMKGERLTENLREFFMEEMRCIREGLLNGEGPVVHSLLNLPMEAKIEEPPHQKKYLENLLGAETGLFLEGGSISFDQNGGEVLEGLRDCSRQEVLDTLYEFHTPKTIIEYFHMQFQQKGLKGKVDEKHKTWDVMGSLLSSDQLQNEDYVILDDDFIPQGLTPLAVAQFLIKTGILDVVESH